MHRIFRLIWGTDFDPEIRPLFAVSFTETFAGSALFVFLGIWALEHLGASQVQLSVAFLFGALAAVVAGWVGGHLSDHVGRRPVMLAAMWAYAAVPLLMILVRHHVIAGLVVMSLTGVCGAMFNASSNALIADLLPPARREAGYASVRVASNLGVCFGPAVGALLLLGDAWTRLDIGVFLFCMAALFFAIRYVPHTGVHAPEGPPERNSFKVVVRDYSFLLFVGSSVLASMTYVAFDSLLPISLATTHGIAPSVWGFLVIINAGLVAFGQLRLTRAVERYSPSLKLAVAMPLMGFPFLFLRADDSIAVVAILMTFFVIGEMLWVPTSQAVVARFAPVDLRGAYMGVYGSAAQAAWSLTPFLGLQVRHFYGDFTMWIGIAAISLLAATAGAIAASERRVALASPA